MSDDMHLSAWGTRWRASLWWEAVTSAERVAQPIARHQQQNPATPLCWVHLRADRAATVLAIVAGSLCRQATAGASLSHTRGGVGEARSLLNSEQFRPAPWTERPPRWQAERAVFVREGAPCPAWDGG